MARFFRNFVIGFLIAFVGHRIADFTHARFVVGFFVGVAMLIASGWRPAPGAERAA